MPGSLSPRLLEGAARLGSRLPFAKAADELAFFWEAQIGAETLRRHTLAAGAAAAAVEAAEVARLEREFPSPPAGPALQQVSMDGAMVCLVGGEWAEVKTAAIGAVTSRPGKDGTPEAHTVDLSYRSRLADAASFGRVLHLELHRRGAQAATAVAVNDGAVWIQGLLDTYCRDAVRVLDFAHVAEHLASAAAAAFGADTPAMHAWLDRQVQALKAIGPDGVLGALAGLPVGGAAAAPDAAARRNEVRAYLAGRLPQLQYPTFLARGYPIGSGAVESAGQLVVEARLKGAGMRWAPASVTPMLVLRAACCSGRWAQAWAALTQRLRQQERDRRRARFQRRHLAPVPDQPAPPDLRLLRSAARKLRAHSRPQPTRPSDRSPRGASHRRQAS